jgi:hypothetical protein
MQNLAPVAQDELIGERDAGGVSSAGAMAYRNLGALRWISTVAILAKHYERLATNGSHDR